MLEKHRSESKVEPEPLGVQDAQGVSMDPHIHYPTMFGKMFWNPFGDDPCRKMFHDD